MSVKYWNVGVPWKRVFVVLVGLLLVLGVVFWAQGRGARPQGQEPNTEETLNHQCAPSDSELDDLIQNPDTPEVVVRYPRELIYVSDEDDGDLDRQLEELIDARGEEWRDIVSQVDKESASFVMVFTQEQRRSYLSQVLTSICENEPSAPGQVSDDYRVLTYPLQQNELENSWSEIIQFEWLLYAMSGVQLYAGFDDYEWRLDLVDADSGALLMSVDSNQTKGHLPDFRQGETAAGDDAVYLILNKDEGREIEWTEESWNAMFDAANTP